MVHEVPSPRPLRPDAEGQWVRRWTSAEWTQTVDTWVIDRLAARGRTVTGDGITYRARFWSAVRCYSTAEGLVWFKENNPGHRFEADLVAALAELARDDVLVPLAVDRDRSWLLTDDQGPTLTHADVANQQTRRTVVRALARLQRTLVGRVTASLLTLNPQAAGDELRAITRTWATFPPDHPLHLSPDTLRRAEQAAADLNRRTPSLTIPLDLDFNDVYPANIFATRIDGDLKLRFLTSGTRSEDTRSSPCTVSLTQWRSGPANRSLPATARSCTRPT
ncbi:hypothetical protein AB0E69_02600 [Kribbella sp. NPDC026611]|uniref:hypothetical protein n=1 Tax=Kribbella sp. NPDC026611 TaxID=3154911 RepID=UPI0033ED080A